MTAMVPMLADQGPKLTDKQSALVEALLDGVPEKEALELAGYFEGGSARKALASRSVQAALKAGCDAAMAGRIKVKALGALDALLDPATPAATRFAAAKYALDYGKEADEGAVGELSKMTAEQLTKVIRDAEASIRGEMIDVTPNNGAQPDA